MRFAGIAFGVKRVLVTGSTGFFGSRAVRALQLRGDTVYRVGRSAAGKDAFPVDLLAGASARTLLARLQPTHVLHLAWTAEPNAFWTDPRNLDWCSATLALARAAVECGVTRFVAAGSSAEYTWSGERLTEQSERHPTTLYGTAKTFTYELLSIFFRQAALSFAWGRPFFAYGAGEPGEKLISWSARELLAGRDVELVAGANRLDFIHVDDVVAAFIALLDSTETGDFNIGSGSSRTVSEAVAEIASVLGHGHVSAARHHRPQSVCADITKITALGWTPRVELRDGISEILTFLRRAAHDLN